MLRTALLWGNTITLDADLSKYIETLSDQWVIEWLEVSSNSVALGKAWVKATRSNGETIMTLVQNTEALAVDTSGTKKIWLEIRQEAIDNGLLNNEDWTGIASIKTWPSVPSQNFLLLASVAENVIKDERNLIPKIQSVAQKTSVLEEKMTTAEGQISQLAEAGAVDHLEESGIVGEKYTLENQLFKQYTPKAEDSTVAINIGENDKNKEIHIQRIGSWTASNQLKLKMKKFWAPTTSVIVEVRKWIKVDVSDKEAYRYGGEVIASTTIAYTEFLADWKEFTFTLNNQFGGTKGELLDIVVYQQGGIVNATNYYQIACDSTQYSEAFSYVSVNWSSRVRNKLMPYCISEGFAQWLLAKADIVLYDWPFSVQRAQSFWMVYSSEPTMVNFVRYEISSSRRTSLYFMKDGSQVVKMLNDWKNSGIFTATNAAFFKFYAEEYSGWTAKFTMPKTKFESSMITFCPRTLWSIGDVVSSTLVWPHIDWKHHRIINTLLSMSATSGEGAPINAVGYMSIIGADWKKYKIRVYWE